MREKDERYSSVTGTKGYRWLESETVRQTEKEQDVDMRYYEELVSEAIQAINTYGNYDRFVDTSRPYIFEREVKTPKAADIPETAEDDEDLPWSDLPPVVPCGNGKYNSCMECPNCSGDICDAGYSLNSYNGMEMSENAG